MQWIRYKTSARHRPRLAVRTELATYDLQTSYERYLLSGEPAVRGLSAALQSASLCAVLRLSGTEDFLALLRQNDGHHSVPLQIDDRSALLAPLHDPGRFIGIGLNYHDHAREIGQQAPLYPPLFAKWANAINGPYGAIDLPVKSEAVDYEVELGIVIGARARYVSPTDALSCIFGYTVINDISARDLQFQTSQWLAGKICDGFAPIGPTITERQDLPSSADLRLRTWVNGELRQDGRTQDMIHDPASLVSYLSHLITLDPGDIIATGTPAGVGMSHKPPRYLKAGDVVRVDITGLGTLENHVRAGAPKE